MSQSFPPPPGSQPQPGPSPYAPPTQSAGYPYAGQTAYGYPSYAGQPPGMVTSKGFNPWVAALLGALAGAAVTAVLAGLVWLMAGYPMPWQSSEDFIDDWSGTVSVSTDGTVPGQVMADAVRELGGGDYYVEVSCPTTPKVAEGVTTVCRADDGYEDVRVIVYFFDELGSFETAEIYGD